MSLREAKGLQETDGRGEAAGSGGALPGTARTGQVALPALGTVSLFSWAQARVQRPQPLQSGTSCVAGVPAASFLGPEVPRSNE